jgi:hypothetical protein
MTTLAITLSSFNINVASIAVSSLAIPASIVAYARKRSNHYIAVLGVACFQLAASILALYTTHIEGKLVSSPALLFLAAALLTILAHFLIYIITLSALEYWTMSMKQHVPQHALTIVRITGFVFGFGIGVGTTVEVWSWIDFATTEITGSALARISLVYYWYACATLWITVGLGVWMDRSIRTFTHPAIVHKRKQLRWICTLCFLMPLSGVQYLGWLCVVFIALWYGVAVWPTTFVDIQVAPTKAEVV